MMEFGKKDEISVRDERALPLLIDSEIVRIKRATALDIAIYAYFVYLDGVVDDSTIKEVAVRFDMYAEDVYKTLDLLRDMGIAGGGD